MENDINQFGLNLYFGVVESNQDPLELGRVRVRVFGIHSLSKTDIPDESLPWSPCMTPVTSPSINGAGSTPNLEKGSRVLVVFLDNSSLQEPLVIGSMNFIQPEYMVNVNKQMYSGYSDDSDYVNQVSMPQSATSGAVENPSSTLSVKNGVSEFETPENLQKMSRYPLNRVRKSKGGVVEEWDDTPGNVRASLTHPSGSFQQYRPDGSFEQTIYGSNYTIKAKDDNVYIEGVCNLHIQSDCNTHISGDYNLTVGGDYNLNVNGNTFTNVNKSRFDTIGEDESKNIFGSNTKNVGADNIEVVGGENATTIGSTNYQLYKGNTVLVTNGNYSETVKGDHSLKTTGNFVVGAAGTAKINSNSNLTLNSSAVTTIGSSGNIDIASSGMVDINTNSPSITKEDLEVNEIEIADFDKPDFQYVEPSIVAIDADVDVRKSPGGPLSKEEYEQKLNTSQYEAQKSYSNKDSSSNRSSKSTIDYGNLSGFDLLLAFISSGEGGYDSINNGTKGGNIVGTNLNYSYNGKKLSELTFEEIMNLQRGTRETGRILFAVGRYQIIPATLRDIAFPNSGLKKSDIFSKENQDILGKTLLLNGQRKGLADYLTGGDTPLRSAHLEFAMEWASVPDPRTGYSYYGSGNKSSHSIEEVQEALETARRDYITANSGVVG